MTDELSLWRHTDSDTGRPMLQVGICHAGHKWQQPFLPHCGGRGLAAEKQTTFAASNSNIATMRNPTGLIFPSFRTLTLVQSFVDRLNSESHAMASRILVASVPQRYENIALRTPAPLSISAL